MPPRFVNPSPVTASAKEAARTFYCEQCQKGYQRSDEFETHLNSYEHMHRKRYLELRRQHMTTGGGSSSATASNNDGILGQNLLQQAKKSVPSSGPGKGFKRVFKSKTPRPASPPNDSNLNTATNNKEEPQYSDDGSDDGGDYEKYDPAFPTSEKDLTQV